MVNLRVPSELVPYVPYVTAWSSEARPRRRVVPRSTGAGIAFADERPSDRDRRGFLWDRFKLAYGKGKPMFGAVHPGRQRHAMDKLLCQVCAQPADRNTDGVLWMLQDHRDDWVGWPNRMGVTEPPICAPCVEVSRQRCPALRRSHALVRVNTMPVTGVHGTRYVPTGEGVAPGKSGPIDFGADLRWVLATHLVREFRDAVIVN
ncbi:hypothetical protein [Actinokineospora pegani]|uniref:hypothetical protein n=1 Tax=Actinokineospora pegani TaxID=2654637 RepID=UPI0012E9EDC0|nr:hypothetical protein [Actinokineospora pegani]